LRVCHHSLTHAPPRLVIAAPQGRSGKTTVTIALARALRNQGLTVQPFKKGPDYIDPSWLRLASGRDCSNLDNFLMPEDVLLSSFARRSHGADVALVEGAMGLFDSLEPDGKGSVAWLARLLQAPIILVVKVERMTRSVAALVSGFQHFEPGTHVAGVILNHVSGTRHEEKLRDAVERHCGIPVLGVVPRDSRLTITERHLGLVPSAENHQAEPVVKTICEKVGVHLNLDGIMAIAREAPARRIPKLPSIPAAKPACRIGVMADRAFTFYYPENLEALREAGADVVSVDALSDHALPEIDGLYVGGGFPELYATELEANKQLRRAIARCVENGLPTYAECAGLMYLCRAIRWQGKRYEMVGIIPTEVELSRRPEGHGYVEAGVVAENPWFPTGLVLHGHEFHHSRLMVAGPQPATALRIRRGHGIDGHVDGFFYKNMFASYTHLHALGVPQWARSFVALALRYQAAKLKKGVTKLEVKTRQGQTAH
jgi:cobyrinic acid a,c-diamide synthase